MSDNNIQLRIQGEQAERIKALAKRLNRGSTLDWNEQRVARWLLDVGLRHVDANGIMALFAIDDEEPEEL